MEAIDFLKNKGITKATCYTDGGTYYVSELAKLMEEYAALRQPHVKGSLPDANPHTCPECSWSCNCTAQPCCCCL